MIYDVRTYDITPGKLNAYLEVFEKHAKPTADKHGLKLIAFLTTKIGRLNQVVMIWEYTDLSQFETLRAARDADPGWAEYRRQNAGMIVRQEDKIMTGAPFSPLR